MNTHWMSYKYPCIWGKSCNRKIPFFGRNKSCIPRGRRWARETFLHQPKKVSRTSAISTKYARCMLLLLYSKSKFIFSTLVLFHSSILFHTCFLALCSSISYSTCQPSFSTISTPIFSMGQHITRLNASNKIASYCNSSTPTSTTTHSSYST